MPHSLSRTLLLFTLLAQFSPAESTASLRGLLVTPSGIIWASGTNGTVLQGAELGDEMKTCIKPPDAAGLDFRGIYAWDAQHAMVMSAGPGILSRLYETTDGCSTWRLLFTNPDPEGFWDGLTFDPHNPKKGVLLGDPVKGRFTIFRTDDGGHQWTRDNSPSLASNPSGEGAFAASNSSLIILNSAGDLLFGTGGVGGPRVFRFDASARAWTNVSIPIARRNETSGIYSISCRNETVCVAVGGDYKRPENREGTACITRDAGRTWTQTAALPRGYRSGVDWNDGGWTAVGPSGADSSRDDGTHWSALSDKNWNATSRGWAAGQKGQIAPLQFVRD